ncbi:transmembrane protein 71 [Heterocephalus glaber]|uniref:Transmembrane protein 71 n=1 Tax=Heterocephalus glaber TaxID=10181 RepID=A0A0P6J4M6_HETGA|nr:transmembrane protein 71 [Heterocephalus glaber]XP_021107557.1 transmembrane protein 71 [Heterocephalus glaber]
MYRISQLMSTPVASKCSSRLDRECAGKFSTTCIFPRFAWDFLDGDNSFECCSMDPLTGSHNTCRQSPRLLTNGYYIWTEDSFLCDKDGNITLNPSQTRVMYKEKLVGIFRKKRRFCYSLSSLFNISASEYWLHGSTYGDVDTCPREGVWLEGVRRLDASHRSENDEWEMEEKPTKESTEASFSSLVLSQPPKENSQGCCLQAPWKASGHFQECFGSSKYQFAARGLLAGNPVHGMLHHFCVRQVVYGRNISQCLHLHIGDNYSLCCEVIFAQSCEIFQSHHLFLAFSTCGHLSPRKCQKMTKPMNLKEIKQPRINWAPASSFCGEVC